MMVFLASQRESAGEIDLVDRHGAVKRLREISRSVQQHTALFSLENVRYMALRTEAAALIASCLGSDHYLVGKIDRMTPVDSLLRLSAIGQADEFCGYVDAAVTLIGIGPAAPTKSPACDPELWANVGGLVDAELWDKVPSAVVTFVEDWFRRRAGNRRNSRGGKLYGKGLFQELLRPGNGPLALGSEESEAEGWRDLGVGLAKAIGNGHRHSLTDRADAERLAWAVIGLGTLLIGEAKRTHPDDAAHAGRQ